MHVMKVANKKLKKGVTKVFSSVDPRVKGLKQVSDLFDLDDLIQSENFVVKDYKDSFYAGEAS